MNPQVQVEGYPQAETRTSVRPAAAQERLEREIYSDVDELYAELVHTTSPGPCALPDGWRQHLAARSSAA